MKTAQPASLPPGPRSSGGIRRSTAASISEASSDVKNIHGPGRTSAGGVAVPGSHGMPPLRVRARPALVPATSKAAVETRSERRVSLVTVKFLLPCLRSRHIAPDAALSVLPLVPGFVSRFYFDRAGNFSGLIGNVLSLLASAASFAPFPPGLRKSVQEQRPRRLALQQKITMRIARRRCRTTSFPFSPRPG